MYNDKQKLLDAVKTIMDNEYNRGKNYVLSILKDEMEQPTCLTCEYCEYMVDEMGFGEFVTRPFLSDCLHPENKKNKEFMEMFEGYESEFETEAPNKFGCHKFNFEKFKKTCELLENE